MTSVPSILYHRHPDALHTDLITEAVLIHGSTGRSFRLNGSARLLWAALPTSPEDLAALLARTYGLDPLQAHTDVQALLEQLQRLDLVQARTV